jgi:hypothetical protein
MNTEAQRARNKRKRDKLREKRRMVKGDSILRFRLDGYATRYAFPCGLMLREQWIHDRDHFIPWCTSKEVRRKQSREDCMDWYPNEWSTEWVYMTTHDVSSSAHDAICAFINTGREFHDQEFDKAVLVIQLNGQTRRYVWRGHTPGLNAVIRRLSACRRALSVMQ